MFICACHLALQMCPGENVLRPVSPVHSLPHFPIPVIYTTHYFWHQLFRRAQKSSVCTVTGHPPWASGHPTHVSHTPESFPFQPLFLQMLETESRSCQTVQGSFSQHLKWKSMRAVRTNCLRLLAIFLRDVEGRQKPQIFQSSDSDEKERNNYVFRVKNNCKRCLTSASQTKSIIHSDLDQSGRIREIKQ